MIFIRRCNVLYPYQMKAKSAGKLCTYILCLVSQSTQPNLMKFDIGGREVFVLFRTNQLVCENRME
jgi:hypothetical protein